MLVKIIIFTVFVFCILTAFPILANAQYAPDVQLILSSEIYHFGDKLDYTIIVSDVTGEDASIYITDYNDIRSPLFSTPISQKETHVIAPIGFDSIIWNEGKYVLELEYSGATHKANFTIIDDGSIGIPYWISDIAKLWLTNQIPDKEFAKTIQYMINNDILDNPKPGNTLDIPQWFKYTTSWWASQQISDSSYGMAIQYLIDEKFLTIPFDQEASDSASSFL